jgi:hypothetical protein
MNDDIDIKYTLEQYRQCYEDYRQLWILFWRIPTIAVTISAAVFAAVFIYIWPQGEGDLGSFRWIQSGIVLLIGHILTLVLAYVAYKHRYFSSIWQGTLTVIEETVPFKNCVKRITFPEKEISHNKNYWLNIPAKRQQSPSGELVLILALLIISLISLGFSMYAFSKHSMCSFGIALPSWLAILFLWLLLSGFKLKSQS